MEVEEDGDNAGDDDADDDAGEDGAGDGVNVVKPFKRVDDDDKVVVVTTPSIVLKWIKGPEGKLNTQMKNIV